MHTTDHDDEHTIPDTIAALAKELRAAERRQEARDALILSEIKSHRTRLAEATAAHETLTDAVHANGQALAELAKAVADLNARVDIHDKWEREGRGDNGAIGG